MRLMRLTFLAVIGAACLAVLGAATGPEVSYAQGVPGFDANKCLAGKNKCVSKKMKGLLKCREKCQKKPDKCDAVQTACETKVRDKFDGGLKPDKGCFVKLEAKADVMKPDSVCTTSGDTAAMESKVDAVVAELLAVLEGTAVLSVCGDGVAEGNESCDDTDLGGATCASLGFASGTLACTAGCGYDLSGCTPHPAPTCGNGTIESPESCDGVDLGGATCTSLGFASGALACTAGCGYDVSGCAGPTSPLLATGQTTCWNLGGSVVPCAGTGHDGDFQAGAALAYVDNGDGTITDLNTGLMWEKKSDDGGINRFDTQTSIWDNAFVKVATLNSAVFAGHTDWRVPNVRELASILNYENHTPAVSPAFDNNCTPGCTVLTCSCTYSGQYWTSTTDARSTGRVFQVDFREGLVVASLKAGNGFVRAVRGGL